MKKFIIFFICVPLVYSELHKFITTYTEINGQTAAGTPQFSAVTTLDGQQIDYYDSNIEKLIPRQDWMKNFTSTHMWKEYTDIREKLQQIYEINIHVLMERFNQTHGVHTYQRMYGCDWDDETGDSQGFDEYGYDGEDFISLDLKENRYTPSVPQATPTVEKWNNDTAQLETLKQNLPSKCVYWLRKFLYLSETTFKKTELPKVSLLQKKDNYVGCHVTGFLFRNTHISWRKNEQAVNHNSLISGDTLPNEDGTFQRRLTLYILPDEWKEDRYTCVVEHKSWTESIQKSLTEDQIKKNEPASDSSNIKYDENMAGDKTKSNRSASDSSSINYLALVIITVIVGLIVLWKHRKKLIDSYKKMPYYKSKPSQEKAPSQDSLLSQTHQKSVICESAASPGSFRDEQNHSPETFTVPHRWTDLPNPSRQLSPL